MSKRKNRQSAPNIPQATLDRAREQLSGTPAPVEPAPIVEEAQPVEPLVATTPAPRPAVPSAVSARRSRRRPQAAQARSGRKEVLDTEMIKNRLDHPTRVVTEAQLQQEYGYVIKDLRAIGILAAVMIALMVIIAQLG